MAHRYIYTVFITAILFASACSKKNSPQPGSGTGSTDTTKTTGTGGTTTTPTVKTYLPVSVYISTTHDTTKHLLYSLGYDSKNRIIMYAYGGYIADGPDTTTFAYDSQNRLSETDDNNKNHVAFHTTKFSYPNDSTIMLDANNGLGGMTYHLHNGLLTLITYANGTATVNYTYDARNNLSTEGRFTYTYDDAKSPFSMVTGYRPYFMTYDFAGTYPGTNINNKLTDPLNNWTLSYTFNKDGFPTKMRVAETGTVGYTYYWYNYQVK